MHQSFSISRNFVEFHGFTSMEVSEFIARGTFKRETDFYRPTDTKDWIPLMDWEHKFVRAEKRSTEKSRR